MPAAIFSRSLSQSRPASRPALPPSPEYSCRGPGCETFHLPIAAPSKRCPSAAVPALFSIATARQPHPPSRYTARAHRTAPLTATRHPIAAISHPSFSARSAAPAAKFRPDSLSPYRESARLRLKIPLPDAFSGPASCLPVSRAPIESPLAPVRIPQAPPHCSTHRALPDSAPAQSTSLRHAAAIDATAPPSEKALPDAAAARQHRRLRKDSSTRWLPARDPRLSIQA